MGPMAAAHLFMSSPNPSPDESSPKSCSGEGGVPIGSAPGAGTVMADKTGRQASSARAVQSPRPTGMQVRRRPSEETGMPVVSVTCSSATRANSSSRIRCSGSTFGSAAPPVATFKPKARVSSH